MAQAPSLDCIAAVDRHGNIALNRGDTIIIASRPTAVLIGSKRVHLGAGAIAEIEHYDEVILVRDLSDQHANSVCIAGGAAKLCLAPGEQCILTDGTANRVRQVDETAYRNAQVGALDGCRYSHSEFSIPSAMSHGVLKDILRTRTDDALFGKLLKTATIVSLLTAEHGRYHNRAITNQRSYP